jgi:hypothetical protein
MNTTIPTQDLSEQGQIGRPGSFGIASLACAAGAIAGVLGLWMGAGTGTLWLGPVGGAGAVALGVTSLARHERHRPLAIAGLVIGGIAVLATVLLVIVAVLALSQWQD